ncbi:MAG: FAD-dependent oxidoreductase [Elusimicrobia bacterium]|nr:FAD-dependent oxidoreductase [Elusimicrobiota bacterium]
MNERKVRYLIVGGGLAGASAAQAIRRRDANGSILILTDEPHHPYDRPPLTKALWLQGKPPEYVFLHEREFYERKVIDIRTGTRAVGIDPVNRVVTDTHCRQFLYDKLLLATGGAPRRLDAQGGGAEGVCHYRTLDDYLATRLLARPGRSALVVGGGFIGSELAAALASKEVDVTMAFTSPYLCSHVFPEPLGRALQARFREHGVRILTRDTPVALSHGRGRYSVATKGGRRLDTDMVLVGVGIDPEVSLAQTAGLAARDGVEVDEYLQTSAPDIYAAGDNCSFPSLPWGRRRRIEHWDNAAEQGRVAGENMAGGHENYSHLPFFFSDLFDFGYEAVGEVDTQHDTFCDWEVENKVGAVYYLKDRRVRGVMLCGIYGRMEDARRLILKGERVSPSSLRGAISSSRSFSA